MASGKKQTGLSSSMEERLRTLKEALTSRNLVEKAVKKIDLDVKMKNDAQYNDRIEDIIKKLGVTTKVLKDRQTADLFEISYQGSDPKTVRDLVNALVSEYIEENIGYKRTEATESYDFVRSQMMEYKKKLDESDSAIRAFRERNRGLDAQRETTVAARMETFEGARADSEIKLKELLRKRENLRKQLSGEKEITSVQGGPQAKLMDLNNQLMVLSAKYTDDYPEVIKVKSEIEELKKQITDAVSSKAQSSRSEAAAMNPVYQQLKEQLSQTDGEIETLKARIQEISGQRNAAASILARMPRAQEELSKLERDKSVYQKIYDDLMQKLEDASASKQLELTNNAGNFRVVDPAVLPYLPVKPNTVLMIAVGILLGIASGTGLVIMIDYFTHSFKDEDSIQMRFNLPVLSTIQTVTSEEDRISAKKIDRKFFTAAGLYSLLIFLVLVEEFLHRYLGIKTINF
jgi:succinoglycan biosynthesis transport protein ExoP